MRKSKEIKERKTETERDMRHTDLRSFVYSAYSRCIKCNQLLGNKVISTYLDYCKHTGEKLHQQIQKIKKN